MSGSPYWPATITGYGKGFQTGIGVVKTVTASCGVSVGRTNDGMILLAVHRGAEDACCPLTDAEARHLRDLIDGLLAESEAA